MLSEDPPTEDIHLLEKLPQKAQRPTTFAYNCLRRLKVMYITSHLDPTPSVLPPDPHDRPDHQGQDTHHHSQDQERSVLLPYLYSRRKIGVLSSVPLRSRRYLTGHIEIGTYQRGQGEDGYQNDQAHGHRNRSVDHRCAAIVTEEEVFLLRFSPRLHRGADVQEFINQLVV